MQTLRLIKFMQRFRTTQDLFSFQLLSRLKALKENKQKRFEQSKRCLGQNIVVLMYKTKTTFSPKYIADLFQMTNTKYSLRNKEFAMPRFNTTTHGKHSIRYISPKLWSLIPKNVRDLPALSVFKQQRIRKLDLNSLQADVHCSECISCHT